MDSFLDVDPHPFDEESTPVVDDRPPHRQPSTFSGADPQTMTDLKRSIEALNMRFSDSVLAHELRASPDHDLISKTKVLRGGSAMLIIFAMLLLAGNIASGQPIIQPLIGVLMILFGLVFHVMSFIKA